MEFPKTYNKPQIVLNSERLILNSKVDSIIICSNSLISLSAKKSVHIDIGPSVASNPEENYLVVNSPKIKLGLNANQSVIKGNNFFSELIDFLNRLKEVGDKLKQSTDIDGNPLIEIQGAGDSLITHIDAFQSKLRLNSTNQDSLLSNINFIE